MTASLRARLAALERRLPARSAASTGSYAADPAGYVREVLGQQLWAAQEEIARKLLEPPYKVLVKSGHNIGKSFLAACLTNWWYDTFDPGCVITTAPTYRDVCDILWSEVRLLRGGRGGFVGRSAPELRSGPGHFAKGFTADKGESFQGRHRQRMLFLFDEAVGIEPVFWTTTRSMFKPGGEHGWVCFFNPTDSSSQAYQEEQRGGWSTVVMSALDHPNVAAELAGLPPPFPAAVSLAQVNDWLAEWADPIEAADAQVTDIHWPPGSGHWLRPGPLAESRVLGRWPSQAAYSVWSDSLWQAVLGTRHALRPAWPVRIGCDVARFGDDHTAIHIRKGLCSLHHERHNGWSTDRTAGRLKQLCHQFGDAHNPERRIPVLIDVGGLGAGVVDQRGGHNFVAVNSAGEPSLPERYLNIRSELWFAGRDCARKGLIDLSRLEPAARRELGRQLLAPRYTIDAAGRQVVEPKADTKKRIRCSPDDADSWNLCYLAYNPAAERVAGTTE